MLLANFLKPSPSIRPQLNIGCLFDIPTGKYLVGKHGEHILNAGLSYVTGIGGRGNTFKSTIAHFQNLSAMNRYAPAEGSWYDTETSLTVPRLNKLSEAMLQIAGKNIFQADEFGPQRAVLSDTTQYLGNEWFEQLKQLASHKQANSKDLMIETPFWDAEAKAHLSALKPTLAVNDSLSMMPLDSVDKIYNKHEIGDGGMNVEAMKSSAAKSQMLMQMPHLTARAGIYVTMTAHVGDEIQVDMYAPSQKKLSFLKGKMKFKQVPEKFTFLTNNLWFCAGTTVLNNATTKAPEYPRNREDDMKGDTDLQLVSVTNLRAKTGPTGIPLEIVCSQAEGVKVELTEFHYCKTNDRYGIGGTLQNYFLELVPDVKLSRTTVRNKIESDPKIKRALEIQSEMCQMGLYWHDLEEGLLCTPAELYADLKAKGYDWDTLLNTRGYWVFEGDDNPLPFLSTMDLLQMRKGNYHPYWMKEKPTASK